MGWFGKRSDAAEHRYAEKRLSAYLDGELSSREQGRVARHVGGCRRCRWELDTLRRTVQWTQELPRVPVPRAFTIPATAQPARAVGRAWGVPVLQGATALVALLFFLAIAGERLAPRWLAGSQPENVAVGEPTQVAVLVVEVTLEVEALQAVAPELPPSEEASLEAPMAEAAVVAVEAAAPLPGAEGTGAPPGMGVGGGPTETLVTATEIPAGGGPPPATAAAGAAATLPPPSAPEATPPPAADATARGLTTAPTATAQPTGTPTRKASKVAPTVTATEQPTETAAPSWDAQAEEAPAEPVSDTVVLKALPTVEAAAAQSAAKEVAEEDRARAAAGAEEAAPPGGRPWLSATVIALGAAFALLGTITFAFTVRRLRRRS